MSKQILFVDDSETLRDLASMSLEVLGDFEVTVASHGLQAKNLLENRSFDLVITDLDMPKMYRRMFQGMVQRPGYTVCTAVARGKARRVQIFQR